MKKITPIILCGGSGTRLWPLSRAEYPKQFLTIIGDHSLFQQTVLRLSKLPPPICIANYENRFIIEKQLNSLGTKSSTILLEPEGRNTAPAIATAIHYVSQLTKDADHQLLVIPADHYVTGEEAFMQAIELASELAAKNHLLTFGIKPAYAETGYGYIHAKDSLQTGLKVKKFTEKPNLSNAKHYLQEGNYFWNSGIFLFNIKTMAKEMQQHCPIIWKKTQESVNKKSKNLNFIQLGSEILDCPSISIDYAIMEKATSVAMVPLNCHWSDVGSFKAIADLSDKNTDNNTLIGDTISIDSKNNLIQSSDNRLIATVGVKNTIVVDTPDATLVADKGSLQDIAKVVAKLKERKDCRATTPNRVHRPWGWYESISSGSTYQVKRLHIYPGSSLSLQKHRYRSEHWVVIKGTASVHCDGEETELQENTSTFIPLGAVHRLTNKTKGELEIIEVQNGSYLGEDDIIRLQDDYQRT